MKEIQSYLDANATEAFIPLFDGDDLTKMMRSIKSYCHHFKAKNSIEAVYGCSASGNAYRFVHVVLEKPIERKKTWKKKS